MPVMPEMTELTSRPSRLREGDGDELPRQIRGCFFRFDARGRILGQCARNSEWEAAGCSLFV